MLQLSFWVVRVRKISQHVIPEGLFRTRVRFAGKASLWEVGEAPLCSCFQSFLVARMSQSPAPALLLSFMLYTGPEGVLWQLKIKKPSV